MLNFRTDLALERRDVIKKANNLENVEGVETEEQVRFLKQSGCDYIQGYYYSRPLPEDEFIEFLEKESLKN